MCNIYIRCTYCKCEVSRRASNLLVHNYHYPAHELITHTTRCPPMPASTVTQPHDATSTLNSSFRACPMDTVHANTRVSMPTHECPWQRTSVHANPRAHFTKKKKTCRQGHHSLRELTVKLCVIMKSNTPLSVQTTVTAKHINSYNLPNLAPPACWKRLVKIPRPRSQTIARHTIGHCHPLGVTSHEESPCRQEKPLST
jgi:hypothetical protein